jgi:hypothetical protein
MENKPTIAGIPFRDIAKSSPAEVPSYLIPYLTIIAFSFVYSRLYSDESRFVAFVKSKTGSQIGSDFGCMILAILLILAAACIAEKVLPLSKKTSLTDRVLLEIPRAIYLLGSTFAGTVTAVWLFSITSGKPIDISGWTYILANVFGLIFFGFGATIKYLLEQKHKQDK